MTALNRIETPMLSLIPGVAGFGGDRSQRWSLSLYQAGAQPHVHLQTRKGPSLDTEAPGSLIVDLRPQLSLV